jgi:hypothetical protein
MKKFHVKHTYVCEISSSHGGEYDVQNFLLGCTEDNSEHTSYYFCSSL